MNDGGVSKEGWFALVAVLKRIGILSEDATTLHFLTPPEDCLPGPLAHGASLGLFDEWEAIGRVAKLLSIRAISLAPHEVPAASRLLDERTLKKVPLDVWRRVRAIPLGTEHGARVVCMANPLDRDGKQQIDFLLGDPTTSIIAPESHIVAVLAHRESLGPCEFTEDLHYAEAITPALQSSQIESGNISASDVDAPPIVRLVNKIFLDSFERKASDIHVSPEKDELIVRIRADGLMHDLFSAPAHLAPPVLSRLKLLAGMDISEKRRPQDGRVRVNVGNSYRDLRVSTVPTLYGENLVARILNSDPTHLSLESLGMPEGVLSAFSKDLAGTSQVLLVTGPTGSGKTSTLYSALGKLKDGLHNIVTIEDPIEYRIDGITQIQVNQKVGITFADALRSVLRQDPDVVVIGEIRDGETASIAMNAAQTGHVVLATLHTNTAAAAITRLRDLNIPTYLITSSVRGILAQRLVRRLCSSCRSPDDSPQTRALLGNRASHAKAHLAVGCDECGGSGYSGRAGVYSYLHLSDEIRHAIRDGVSESDVESLAHPVGFTSLEESALYLVASGVTSRAEAERVLGELSNPAPIVATQKNPAPVPPLKKSRVLVAEDDENVRFVIAMLLERASYEVVAVENGRRALEEVYTTRPDLILCDLMMPQMDGVTAVRILRRDPETRSIPILMLTAADSPENEIKLLECGADDFVSKTADKRVLLSRVERLLGRKAATSPLK